MRVCQLQTVNCGKALQSIYIWLIWVHVRWYIRTRTRKTLFTRPFVLVCANPRWCRTLHFGTPLLRILFPHVLCVLKLNRPNYCGNCLVQLVIFCRDPFSFGALSGPHLDRANDESSIFSIKEKSY